MKKKHNLKTQSVDLTCRTGMQDKVWRNLNNSVSGPLEQFDRAAKIRYRQRRKGSTSNLNAALVLFTGKSQDQLLLCRQKSRNADSSLHCFLFLSPKITILPGDCGAVVI